MALFAVTNINWDTEDDGEIRDATDLGLPFETRVECDEDDDVVNVLSDIYGYCVNSCDIREIK